MIDLLTSHWGQVGAALGVVIVAVVCWLAFTRKKR